jgi:hypothetical protein
MNPMIRDALDRLRQTVGTNVTVAGDGGFRAKCRAIVSYDDEVLDPIAGDRQRTTITLPHDVFGPTPGSFPNQIRITEDETGIVHTVVNLKHRRNDIICYCEMSDAGRVFSGPFTQ